MTSWSWSSPLPPNTLVAGRLALIISGATATFDNIRVWKLPALGAEEFDRLLEQTCTTPLVIAHRGNSLHAPENTLEAIRQAIEAGADLVEVDVNMSKDGVVVLMHDYTVDRTTNGKGEGLGSDAGRVEGAGCRRLERSEASASEPSRWRRPAAWPRGRCPLCSISKAMDTLKRSPRW